MRLILSKRVWLLTLFFWLGLIGVGYAWLLHYSFAPGKTNTAPRRLPPDLALAKPSTRAQLFVALHPRCPCSRATVRELAKIQNCAAAATDITVLIYKPADAPDSWVEGALLDDCRRMKCQVRPDPEGRLATSLGSLTSGGVVLYDRNGSLRYQGGITASRGHEGDNTGERAVIEILRGSRQTYRTMPVFGCPIQPEPTNR